MTKRRGPKKEPPLQLYKVFFCFNIVLLSLFFFGGGGLILTGVKKNVVAGKSATPQFHSSESDWTALLRIASLRLHDWFPGFLFCGS